MLPLFSARTLNVTLSPRCTICGALNSSRISGEIILMKTDVLFVATRSCASLPCALAEISVFP